MADTLKVEKRAETGTRRMQRLRASGRVPAILYGHGEANVQLTLSSRELEAVLKHSGHIVQLTGDVTESALIKEVQWDHVSQECLHVDLTRVDADEMVEVTLEIVLKGEAKGGKAGGVINHVLHEIDVMCPASAIPERLELDITDLELGGALRVSDLKLASNFRFEGSPGLTIVTCALPVEETEGEGGDQPKEPEVITGAKSAEADEEG